MNAEPWILTTDSTPPDSAADAAPVGLADYEEIRRKLVRAVRQVCPAWLAQDADDLVQEALLRVLRRDGDNREALKDAYFKRVAYSVVVDEIRRRRRRPGDVAQDEELSENSLPDSRTQATPEGAIGNGIAICLQRQNADRRRALTLHLLGHSIADAARLMSCKVKKAENLIYRGLAQLRICLAELGLAP